MLMNARIISKHDAEVLQAAANVLSRLQHESNSRLDAWRKLQNHKYPKTIGMLNVSMDIL